MRNDRRVRLSSRMDVALVSCRDLPEPDPDAAPLADALSRAGIEAEVLGWDDETFLRHLQERFGFRLGRLSRVGGRSAYPLRLLRVKEMVRPRVALIGNAAHTLHPVAGQGFNLGLRDVAALADVLTEARRRRLDPGSMLVLERYAAQRTGDQQRVALITDALARLFANPLPPLRLARNLGLLALDLAPPAKQGVTRQFMLLRGRLPRLSRGLPLA